MEHAPWTTPFKATQFGPGCPQQCNEPPFVCPTVLSEDCLQLNVFTPRNATADSRLPVLVFWSGGNYKLMTAGTELYYCTTRLLLLLLLLLILLSRLL